MDWFLYDNDLHHERVKTFEEPTLPVEIRCVDRIPENI